MNITIINDCRDANATARQTIRAKALIGGTVSFIGVSNDLEAAGNLIDALDAYGETPGVILVNVAPRNGRGKEWPNGTPFGYFWYKEVLVVASIDGLTLSLVKKLGLIQEINILDIPTVVSLFVSKKIITEEVGQHIIDTQFRSYDFLPRVAAYLIQYKEIISEVYSIDRVVDVPKSIWWVDNFGNCKTTLFKEELIVSGGGERQIETRFGVVPYFDRLKDVPNDTTALIMGSSGIGEKRFIEFVIQGKSAAMQFDLHGGDIVVDSR